MQVNIYDSRQALSQALTHSILKLSASCAKKRRSFCVALSGGSLVDILAMALARDLPDGDVDWSTWHVFWADERWVPWQSPESNYGVANSRLLRHVPIPGGQIYPMDTSQSPERAAKAYASILEAVCRPGRGRLPRLDLILLGIGPDGHTASLFPDHPVLHESVEWVSPVMDAPKPPPNRITLTLPLINHARHIAWVATGPGKADIVARILNPSPGSKKLPAGLVSPSNGDARWFIDQGAAAGL
jgi:6-phosphogluconolactonase